MLIRGWQRHQLEHLVINAITVIYQVKIPTLLVTQHFLCPFNARRYMVIAGFTALFYNESP